MRIWEEGIGRCGELVLFSGWLLDEMEGES